MQSSFEVLTFNVNTAGSARLGSRAVGLRALLQRGLEAQVMLIQVLHLLATASLELSNYAASRGWVMSVSPSPPSPARGYTAGVALLIRKRMVADDVCSVPCATWAVGRRYN